MKSSTTEILLEKPENAEAVEELSAIAFGPGRFARTAFRLREGVASIPELSFVLYHQGELIGSVKLTRIKVGEQDSLVLGPLVVKPDFKNCGFGKSLMEKAVEAARGAGESHIILVGDEPYYARFGFEKVPPGNILMPGPVDPHRLLVCYLQESSDAVTGVASRAV
ncbi:MAG: N-acetyltransferase [Rhizobiaceae bacterium]|nr:N-acetyltransferase [Rhizobiaceae bacterium]